MPGGVPALNDMRGGPGTSDPGQIHYLISLKALILTAYGISGYRLSGQNNWDLDMYEIVAKVPAGATKADFSVMLQNLLKERFNLSVHHENKEIPVYGLTVAKDGPKLGAAAPADSEPSPQDPRQADKDGFLFLPPGTRKITSSTTRGVIRINARMANAADIANSVAIWVDRPLLDETGLTGVYDFRLKFLRAGSPGARAGDDDLREDDLFKAIQVQLGLKLEPKKEPLDCVVIDHVDRIPTEN